MSNCPKCNDPHLISYSSLQKKQCSGCGAMLTWELKPDQPPLVNNNRDKRRSK